MSTTVNKKALHLITLMGKIAKGEVLFPQDKNLQYALFGDNSEATQRKVYNYLKDIHEHFHQLIVIEKIKIEHFPRQVDSYRLVEKNDISKLLKFFIEEKPDFTWAIQMLHEQDPDLLQDMEEQTKQVIENQLREDKEIFLFASKPFETFESEEEKRIFKSIKKAVKDSEYRTIIFLNPNGKEYTFKNAKCLKIVYITGKWYIAIESEENKFKLRRLKSIKSIKNVSSSKSSKYHKNTLNKYKDFFLRLEDGHMKPSDKIKTARLKVIGKERHRFTEDSTKYFKSQKHIETNKEDKYVIFTIEYGDDMEILPFIKRWLPNIIIEGPRELNQRLKKDIRKTITSYEWKNMHS